MNTVKVSQKGWIVIPKEIRERYGIHPGTRVAVVDYGGGISLVPLPDDPIEAAQGFLRDFRQEEGTTSLTEELLQERRQEYEREEAKIQHFGE